MAQRGATLWSVQHSPVTTLPLSLSTDSMCLHGLCWVKRGGKERGRCWELSIWWTSENVFDFWIKPWQPLYSGWCWRWAGPRYSLTKLLPFSLWPCHHDGFNLFGYGTTVTTQMNHNTELRKRDGQITWSKMDLSEWVTGGHLCSPLYCAVHLLPTQPTVPEWHTPFQLIKECLG